MGKKPLSLPDRFKNLISNLQMDNQTTVSRRFKEIAKRINGEFWKIKSDQRNTHYIGSYGRGTAIKGNGNLNIMGVLPADIFQHFDSYNGNGQLALLKELKIVISKSYADTIIKEEEKGEVVIPFKDKMEIEVIPAFINDRGNYYYPNIDGDGSWNEFNPLKEIEVINSQNYEYNGKIKHLGKMMRAWKYTNDVPISGMLIDTMAIDFMEEWEGNDRSYSYYGNMIMDFFEYLAGKRTEQVHWYARGSNREISRTGNFGTKANQAYKKTLEALQFESKGDSSEADKCWSEIFGKYFLV